MSDLPVNVLVVEKYRHRQGLERESSFYACGPVRASLEEAKVDALALGQVAELRQVLIEKDVALAAAGAALGRISDNCGCGNECFACRTAEDALAAPTLARAVELDKARREVCEAWGRYLSPDVEDSREVDAAYDRLRALESQ